MKLINLIIGLVSLVSCQEKVIVGYFVPWGKVPADKLSYDKVTHINYGFGLLKNRTDPADIFFDIGYDGKHLKSLLKERPKNVKVLISLGGWTGSQTFSKLVADEKHRQKFIENAMVYLKQGSGEPGPDGWGLDGLDIDWEYPGREGAKCNDYSPKFEQDDSDNYLKLLQELRTRMNTDFGEGKKLLTAAVRVAPFDKNGKPMKDVSAFAKVFDFINIMAYDIMGTWEKTTGPNAPFENGPKGKAVQFSLKQSVEDWSNAKFPLNQITAGLAFYGRTQKVSKDVDACNMYVENRNKTKIQGDLDDRIEESKFCPEGPADYSGVFRYRLLREQKVLVGKTEAGEGYQRFFDDTTKTPYLYNKNMTKFISYDDVESLKFKVDYAIEKNLKGVMYWDMSQDYDNELLDVLQAVRGTTAQSNDCSDGYSEPTQEIKGITPVASGEANKKAISPNTQESSQKKEGTTPICTNKNSYTEAKKGTMAKKKNNPTTSLQPKDFSPAEKSNRVQGSGFSLKFKEGKYHYSHY
ncbi:hypothetical protein DSO57_1006204 [Entomophthora muscae]|uniref:Uncharacterized protein n=1 Tax=Entomophthora muscae TaxID=34485 RepID=A0ACC2SA82_9FUNG|nr:hypothetical protein DSO57_1006204 [Entomophthora muscae]